MSPKKPTASPHFLVFSLLLLLQFPLVSLYLLSHPLLHYGSFECREDDMTCEKCHKTPIGWVPISLSGLIGETAGAKAGAKRQ